MYRVAADDIEIDMTIIYYGMTCKVVGIYIQSPPEIGFTLLEHGKSGPKMFTMTAHCRDVLDVSLKDLLKKL